MLPIKDTLKKVISKTNNWAEFRYHKKSQHVLGVMRGVVSEMSSKHYDGVGIRVLVNGTWGFASTSDLSLEGLEKALKKAEEMAKALSVRKGKKVTIAASKNLAKGEYWVPGYKELGDIPWEKKFELVSQTEQKIRSSAKQIDSASCGYSEVFEEKYIITTDGADAHIKLARPEFKLAAVAADGTKKSRGHEAVGVTGAWDCLFQNYSLEKLIDETGKNAVDLLKAPAAQGGIAKVILSPSMVGLLSHEAIGHTVEADFVLAGSVAQGKIGQQVASPLVTLADSGTSEFFMGAGGTLPVDDEGVITKRVDIIKDGKLNSYLHSRESAGHYGVEPTGNSRAWEFDNEPLIRMRNTFVQPGKDDLDQMISEVKNGFFIDGFEGGQADATGEFMFGANKVRKITDGKLGEYLQSVTVSGQAFQVLSTVDAVSKDFKWDLGSGHCGKGQPAKVDAGGPYLRCELLVGGSQK